MKGLFTLGSLAAAAVIGSVNAVTITATLCDVDNHCKDYAVNATGSCCMLVPNSSLSRFRPLR
jgi:hypothetical protein